jgi:Uma2 family endonuclease
MTTPRVFKRDTHYHTYADYLKWSRDYGDELIDGTAYSREPSGHSPTHQSILAGIGFQIANALDRKRCRVFFVPLDVRFPKSNEQDDQIDTVVQPDGIIVCDLQKFDERGVRGAPDWVAEVLAPETASHDRLVKLPVYKRAGVREIWLIDPMERELTLHRLESGHYGRATVLELKGETTLTAVPGVTVDWDKVLADAY